MIFTRDEERREKEKRETEREKGQERGRKEARNGKKRGEKRRREERGEEGRGGKRRAEISAIQREELDALQAFQNFWQLCRAISPSWGKKKGRDGEGREDSKLRKLKIIRRLEPSALRLEKHLWRNWRKAESWSWRASPAMLRNCVLDVKVTEGRGVCPGQKRILILYKCPSGNDSCGEVWKLRGHHILGDRQ